MPAYDRAVSAIVAVGVPHRLGGGPWDATLLIATVVALFVTHVQIGIRMTPVTTSFAVFAGIAWTYTADQWGVSWALACAALGAVVASAVHRRVEGGRGRLPPV